MAAVPFGIGPMELLICGCLGIVPLGIILVVVLVMKSSGGQPPPPVAGAVPPATPYGTVSDDPATQLERLAALKAQGAITDEEYEAKKAELLARM